MERKYFSCLLLMLIQSFVAISQDASIPFRSSHVYIEAGGIGGFGSLNYERIFPVKSKMKFGVSLGISTIGLTDFEQEFNPDLIFPFAVRAWMGRKHKMEIGIGNTFASTVQVNRTIWEPERTLGFHGNFSIGYRYQKENGRMIWRCHYSPILENFEAYRHWGGLSGGIRF